MFDDAVMVLDVPIKTRRLLIRFMVDGLGMSESL